MTKGFATPSAIKTKKLWERDARQSSRKQLLAIATELENHK
jgi:hypothetical protein